MNSKPNFLEIFLLLEDLERTKSLQSYEKTNLRETHFRNDFVSEGTVKIPSLQQRLSQNWVRRELGH